MPWREKERAAGRLNLLREARKRWLILLNCCVRMHWTNRGSQSETKKRKEREEKKSFHPFLCRPTILLPGPNVMSSTALVVLQSAAPATSPELRPPQLHVLPTTARLAMCNMPFCNSHSACSRSSPRPLPHHFRPFLRPTTTHTHTRTHAHAHARSLSHTHTHKGTQSHHSHGSFVHERVSESGWIERKKEKVSE